MSFIQNENIRKIITLGDSQTGKSSLIYRYTEGYFYPVPTTRGPNFLLKEVEGLTLKIHDTAGQEVYKSIAKIYYNGTDAVLLIYNQNKRESFENCKFWVDELKNFLPPEVPVYLVATQCDTTNEEVWPDEGRQFCENHGIKGFYQVSSLTGNGIPELFSQVVQDLLMQKRRVSENGVGLAGKSLQKRKKKCKC